MSKVNLYELCQKRLRQMEVREDKWTVWERINSHFGYNNWSPKLNVDQLSKRINSSPAEHLWGFLQYLEWIGVLIVHGNPKCFWVRAVYVPAGGTRLVPETNDHTGKYLKLEDIEEIMECLEIGKDCFNKDTVHARRIKYAIEVLRKG